MKSVPSPSSFKQGHTAGSSSLPQRFTPVAVGAALVTGGIGLIALLGWAFNQPILKALWPTLPNVKVNTAIGLVLAGLSLGLLAPPQRSKAAQQGGVACAWLIILLGGATLVQYLFKVDLKIDELITKDDPNPIGTAAPGRMAVMTAINFILKGWALLVMDRVPKKEAMSQAQLLSLVTAIAPLTALVSYAYGVRDVRGGGPFMIVGLMAIPTTVAWISLSVGVLFARTDFGIMRTLTQSTYASYLLRRLLIPSVLVPPVLVSIMLSDFHNLFYVPGFSAAVVAVLGMALLTLFVWRTVSGLELLEARERQAAEAHQRSESELATLFALSPTAVAQIDAESGRFQRVNQRLCEMTGYDQGELLGQTVWELTYPEDLGRYLSTYQGIIKESGGQFTWEQRFLRKDQALLWVQLLGFVMPNATSGGRRAIMIIQDLTRKKDEEQALQEAKLLAEAASQTKSTFLANMSHELRTPLGAMVGFAELLLDERLPAAERRSYAEVIRRNGHVLTRLIDDILDLSKVEAGKVDIETIPVSIPDLVYDVSSLLMPLARESGTDFSVELAGRVPERITSDPVRLRQVLVNVVGNAIKFTGKGGVKLRLALRQRGEAPSLLAFIVEDTGPGISEEQRTRLFQPFSQADSTTTRRYGGTGLGLALSKSLAEALGGDLELTRSTPGRGSVFTVTVATGPLEGKALLDRLPRTRKDDEVGLHPGPRQALAGIEVLLAEDAPDNQLLLTKLLRAQGATVHVAGNGAEAIDQALKRPFDMILMDLQMPEVDGYQATRELRRQGYLRPIVALSAHAMKEDRERSLSAGCNEHLTKPVNLGQLVQVIEHYVPRGN